MATRKGIRFEVYPDASGQYRWRMVDGNNRIVGNGGESFTSKTAAKKATENIMADLADPDNSMGLKMIASVK
jgi:uncharacterized protein YegP (UPF0339 family)